MKKLLVALAAAACFATASNAAQALDLTEGKQYLTMQTQRSAQPEVVEFFSFYCPHCYAFESQYKIPEKVKEAIPQGTSFKQYHVDFLGPQGANLTRAWALAMALKVEDKVRMPLFEKAQKNAFRSMDDIRAVFLENGVTAEQFDGNIESFAVTGLTTKQQNLAKEFEVRGVPDFYVNNKYRINMEGLTHEGDAFISEYVESIKGLLQK